MRTRRRPGRTARVPTGPRSTDTGMVTAEFAVVLPAIVAALMLALAAVAMFSMRVRCADAAQVAARLAARGETTTAVLAAARRVAPPDAHVQVDVRGSDVSVTVATVARLPVLGGLLPGVHVGGAFSEPVEPGPPP